MTLTIYKGETAEIEFTLTDEDGDPYTNQDVFFAMSDPESSAIVMVSKSASVHGDGTRIGMGQPDAGGIATMSISRTNMTGIQPGNYRCIVGAGAHDGSFRIIGEPRALTVLPSVAGGRI